MVKISGNTETGVVKVHTEGTIVDYEIWKSTDPNKAECGGESLILDVETDKGARKIFLGLGNYAYKDDTEEDLSNYYGWKTAENSDGEITWIPPGISEANSLFVQAMQLGVEIDLEFDEREEAFEDLLAPIDIMDISFSPDIVGMEIVVDVKPSKNKNDPDNPFQNYLVTGLSKPESRSRQKIDKSNGESPKKARGGKATSGKTSSEPTRKTRPANRAGKPSTDDVALKASAFEDFHGYLAWFTENMNRTFSLTMLANTIDEFEWTSPKTKRYVANNIAEMIQTGKNNGWLVLDGANSKRMMYLPENGESESDETEEPGEDTEDYEEELEE